MLACSALERVQPRAVSYEEPAAAIREQLSALYQSQEEWSAAARALAGIDLDSGMRVLDPEYKLSNNVKIAMFFLEDDDAVAAETYIKKASSLLAGCKVSARCLPTLWARGR
jgi:COP9 signalosome complex subunit 4